MAQLSQSFRFLCRNCRSQGHTAGTASSLRLFSSTRQRPASVPKFAPTSVAQLDELLATLREKIFIPAALSPQHRRLVYRRRHDALLNKDPGVTVTMDDGEEIRLRPHEEYQKPRKDKSLHDFLTLLEQSRDGWVNLVPFLESLVLSKMMIPDSFYEGLTRKAGESGKEGLLIQCAEMADRTEFRLSRPGVVYELFVAIHKRAAEAGFKDEQLEKAFKKAQQAALLLESEAHRTLATRTSEDGKKISTAEVEARSQAVVLGTLLELAAYKAIQGDAPGDSKKKVASYAEKVAYFLDNRSTSETGTGGNARKAFVVASTSHRLEESLILKNAIETALKVDFAGTSRGVLSKHLKALKKVVESDVKSLRKLPAHGPRRSLQMYDQISK